MLTDAQIYEQHPEIKQLNDVYVELGKGEADRANRVAETGAALTEAQAAARAAIAGATEQVQLAQKALASVQAEQRLLMTKAANAFDEAQADQRAALQRRAEIQRRHNAAIEAAQQAHAAAALAAKEQSEE